jgi:hypothetical protein
MSKAIFLSRKISTITIYLDFDQNSIILIHSTTIVEVELTISTWFARIESKHKICSVSHIACYLD